MTFIPVPNCALAELRFVCDGQKCENTLWFSSATGVTNAKMLDLANYLRDWWDTNLRPHLSNALELHTVAVSDQSVADSISEVIGVIPPLTGGSGAGALPNNCALCITFRTPNRGRSFRGRNYVMGMPEDQVVKSEVSSAFGVFVTDAYFALRTGLTAIGWTWVVVSRHHDKLPRPAGISTPVVGADLIDLTIDSQRRRLPGRGS